MILQWSKYLASSYNSLPVSASAWSAFLQLVLKFLIIYAPVARVPSVASVCLYDCFDWRQPGGGRRCPSRILQSHSCAAPAPRSLPMPWSCRRNTTARVEDATAIRRRSGATAELCRLAVTSKLHFTTHRCRVAGGSLTSDCCCWSFIDAARSLGSSEGRSRNELALSIVDPANVNQLDSPAASFFLASFRFFSSKDFYFVFLSHVYFLNRISKYVARGKTASMWAASLHASRNILELALGTTRNEIDDQSVGSDLRKKGLPKFWVTASTLRGWGNRSSQKKTELAFSLHFDQLQDSATRSDWSSNGLGNRFKLRRVPVRCHSTEGILIRPLTKLRVH